MSQSVENGGDKGVTTLKLHYYKCNPTENMTILVMDPVPSTERAAIANRLMAENHLYAEQVGFVTLVNHSDEEQGFHAILDMMGGEFCANATRSLAAVLRYEGIPGISINGEQVYNLKVSGVMETLKCRVLPLAREAVYQASVELPLPVELETLQMKNDNRLVEGTLVVFPGITHLVVDDSQLTDRKAFQQKVMNKLAHRKDEALGIMFYNPSTHYLTPLVWVRETDTLFWEKGCGSGTAAVGAYLADHFRQSISVDIAQPGGCLSIEAKWNQGIKKICLTGEISIVSNGIAFL